MKRRDDLDFAKGIGIILMVLGHSFSAGNGEALKMWFYSFHMPLFFLVSGILAREKEECRSVAYTVKHRARGLLLPYYFWCSLIAVYLCVMGRKTLVYFLDLVYNIVTFRGVSALWFLTCLYLAEILFSVSRKAYAFNRVLGWGLAVVIGLVGLLAPNGNAVAMVVLRACTGMSFIWLGWIGARIFTDQYQHWLVFGLLCVLHFILARMNGQVDMLSRAFGNGILFYVNALVGTWLIIQTYHLLRAKCLDGARKGISWLGKNSIVLVCTSFFAIEFLRLADYKLLGGFLPKLGNAEGIVLCLAAILLEIPMIQASERFLWFAFGRKKPSE